MTTILSIWLERNNRAFNIVADDPIGVASCDKRKACSKAITWAVVLKDL